jgi:ATP-dependent DNA ligase
VVPDLAPMLADRGLPRGDLAGWAAEPKLDGWRAIVVVDPNLPDGVAVRTRRGHGITSSVPGIGALAALGQLATDLLTACAAHDVEGIVLKRLRSIYRPGERTRRWRKVKSPGWAAHHAQRRRPM